MLHGAHLADNDLSHKNSAANFFVRGYQWPPDLQDLENLVITYEGEFFCTTPTPEFSDKEYLLLFLQQHKEIGEVGFKYSMEDPIAYDIMSRTFSMSMGTTNYHSCGTTALLSCRTAVQRL